MDSEVVEVSMELATESGQKRLHTQRPLTPHKVGDGARTSSSGLAGIQEGRRISIWARDIPSLGAKSEASLGRSILGKDISWVEACGHQWIYMDFDQVALGQGGCGEKPDSPTSEPLDTPSK